MMKRIQSRVKAAVLPRMVEVGWFVFMALAFLLLAFLLWTLAVIGQHTR
jgi:hypothetical protein